MTDRMTKLRQMLDKTPADPFLLFALGMEHKKLRQKDPALDFFRRTIALDPGYAAAYHQAALTCEDAGDVDQAKLLYKEGIAAARAKGDHHAAGEMEGALSMIE
ncbi:MAG: hypothetical protein ACAI43_20755 [Phycisphaerae bacterium]|nr:hypothetical protein [Tepidisphaeraceae bacterium]